MGQGYCLVKFGFSCVVRPAIWLNYSLITMYLSYVVFAYFSHNVMKRDPVRVTLLRVLHEESDNIAMIFYSNVVR